MRAYYGYALIILAAFGWSLLGPLARFCLQHGVTPLEIAFWRACIGGSLFLLFSLREGLRRPESVRDTLFFLLFGILGVGGLFATAATVVEEGGAALAAVLLYTAPVWVAFASRLLFGERFTAGKLGAIAISLAGVVCISYSGNSTGGTLTPRVLMLGLLTGVFYASHFIFTKAFLGRYTPMSIYGLSMPVAALAFLPFLSFSEKSLGDWAVLVVLGVGCTFTTYWLYCMGMKFVEPTRAVILAMLEPCFATLFSWWWWGESFALGGWIGAVMVLSAVVMLVCDTPKTGGETVADTVQPSRKKKRGVQVSSD